jgi:beta-keto acid cleavage enzyme
MLIKACLNGGTSRSQRPRCRRLPASSRPRRSLRSTPRLHHGYGAATWPVLRAAVLLGRDIRVGLEDTTILANGRPASGNGELVEAAVNLVAALGPPA